MTFLERAWLRPQRLWLRRALFRIHLWTGIALGIYVLLISVSGSAIVFRNEFYKNLSPGPKIVPVTGPRLARDALRQAVRKAWPNYSIAYIWESKRENEATEVWIERDGQKKAAENARLIDPFTGRDLGSAQPASLTVVGWLTDLHMNLLAGETGRRVNGVMAILVVILNLTGLLVWWPGTGRVRRNLTIDFRANWKRLNRDLHNVVGFWMFVPVFVFSVTGVYAVFPTPFQVVVNHFSHLQRYALQSSLETPAKEKSETNGIIRIADQTSPRSRESARRALTGSNGDVFLRWLYYLHFGNFGGWQVKALWVMLGLAPPFLFFTGALIWWNRLLSRDARASRRQRSLVSQHKGTPGFPRMA